MLPLCRVYKLIGFCAFKTRKQCESNLFYSGIMFANELSNRQKEKLIELVIRAFPEYPYSELGRDGFIFLNRRSSEKGEKIHWFELTTGRMAHVLLEEKTYKLTGFYHHVMTRKAAHPVNYLYSLVFYKDFKD